MISQCELKTQLYYDQNTGIFTWLLSKSRTAKIGDIAGYLHHEGYLRIGINGSIYPAHHLAWLYVYGKFPKDKIDHINRVRNDNMICNLRECTNAENLKNTKIYSSNKSGFKGVSFHKLTNKWMASAQINSKLKYLGLFLTKELASQAYLKFCKDHHGEFYSDNTHIEVKQRLVIK